MISGDGVPNATPVRGTEGFFGRGHKGALAAGSSRALPDGLGHRSAVPEKPLWDQFDWFTFHCASCGQETFVGREPVQSVTEFKVMCEWLFGDPPICSFCLSSQSI